MPFLARLLPWLFPSKPKEEDWVIVPRSVQEEDSSGENASNHQQNEPFLTGSVPDDDSCQKNISNRQQNEIYLQGCSTEELRKTLRRWSEFGGRPGWTIRTVLTREDLIENILYWQTVTTSVTDVPIFPQGLPLSKD